jgi:DNA-binding beta-propeller fold protein YncE
MNPSTAPRGVLVAGLLVLTAVLLVGCDLLTGGTRATIEVSVTSGVVPLVISFDGTGSTGPDGITTYHWTFGDGESSYESSGDHVYAHAGTFPLTLEVRAADGSTDTARSTITVAPAVWITDANQNRIHKLDMEGNLLLSFDAPAPQPQGITVAEADGQTWLFVACYGNGSQRIFRMDPIDGDANRDYPAPGQSPRNLTFAATEPKRIWHVDALARRLYAINRTNGQVLESYGQNYFSTSPQVTNLPFLWTPQGLDWTPAPNASGYLWYLEGQNRLLYKIKIIPRYDIMSGTELRIEGNPLDIAVFGASAIDWYDGYLWVVDATNHEIVQVDPTTGYPTGVKITGLPGSNTTDLEIQQ